MCNVSYFKYGKFMIYLKRIKNIDRLFLVSAKKAEELLPKWGDRAEFFSRRNALEINTSKNLLFNIEVQGKGIFIDLFQIIRIQIV